MNSSLNLTKVPQRGMLSYESYLRQHGYQLIAGVDEAGRGPLAGPVVAAGVIIEANDNVHAPLEGLTDSKKLTESQREKFYSVIQRDAVSVGTGMQTNHEIDETNILEATLKAMAQAVSSLVPSPDYVIVDGNRQPSVNIPCSAIVKGDNLSLSIAAASVVAKITRDRLMCEYHKIYPEYGFNRHKGYPTPQHKEAIARFGPCEIHRYSFNLGKTSSNST